MRQDFDDKVPREAQLLRVASARQPGRKHNHKPSSRVVERRRAATQRGLQFSRGKVAKVKLAIRAYWRGEVDEYPAVS